MPHHTNNHRPKILHNDSLFIILLLLLALTFIIPLVKTYNPSVLGIATNITIDRLTELTNKERVNKNLPPLVFNNQLSQAAQEKAKDMFSKNYWAHNSPDGKTPWVFIVNANYEYSYAGENLARDFETTEEVVSAWMASPGHKANILSSSYQDIGFAVVTGKLNGRDTTLIVELFGTRKGGSIASLPVKRLPATQVLSKPIINQRLLTNNIAFSFLGLLTLVLTVDAIIIKRRNIIRLVGHNVDHIIFLGSFFLIFAIAWGGVIL